MPEKVISKEKRYVPIKTYCKMTGLSYATVNHMCNSGQVNYITTETGLRRIDTKEHNADAIILEKIGKTENMLAALCKQFNIVL